MTSLWLLLAMALGLALAGNLQNESFLPASIETQSPASWALQVISSKDLRIYDQPYRYDDSAGTGIFVYVIDQGVDPDHMEFQPGQVVPGPTFLPKRCAPGYYVHGTAMASLIAGKFAGVAKNATIMSVQWINGEEPYCNDITKLAEAMDYTLRAITDNDRQNTSVINISGGLTDVDCTELCKLMSDAKSLGIHVVVSAGNAGEDASLWCPAGCSDVITVGSMNETWNMSLFSNFGSSLDLFAPGDRVLAANVRPPSRSYWEIYGTSVSTALVSGVIAYLLGKDGYIDPDSMLELLQDTASKDGLSETLGSPNLVVYNGVGF